MILQHSPLVVDCPVCGRPVEIQSQHVGRDVVCGHCRGEFLAIETDEGSLTAVKQFGKDSLQRAEQLLRGAGDADASIPGRRRQRRAQFVQNGGVSDAVTPRFKRSRTRFTKMRRDRLSPVSLAEDGRRQRDCHLPALKKAKCKIESPPIAMLVDHRDEVFARIATDLAELGMQVVRAKSATEAIILSEACQPTLVVANLDLPDESGWLLACKLRRADHKIRVWLYQPQASRHDEGMAKFLQVEELLNYGGDLIGLAETIHGLMTDWREPKNASSETRQSPAA